MRLKEIERKHKNKGGLLSKIEQDRKELKGKDLEQMRHRENAGRLSGRKLVYCGVINKRKNTFSLSGECEGKKIKVVVVM